MLLLASSSAYFEALVNLRIALGVKKSPDLGFVVTKNSVQSWTEPFYHFSEYELAQNAAVRPSIDAPEVVRHVVKYCFSRILTHTAECPQSKYYCNTSGESKVLDHGKIKESVHKCDIDDNRK